jgi:transforming growth factor-beta-induced protein
MSRVPRLVAALCAVTLVAAACGGDDDATSDTTQAPVTTAAPVETTQPATTEPATTEPMTTEPATTEPMTTEPATTEPATTEPEAVYGTIIDVATEAGEFTTLLAAVEAAGLTETLATREYTVLAPTDAAFEALGQDVIDAVLADSEALTALLLNHVLPLPQTVDQIGIFQNVLAVGGASWDIDDSGEQLRIGPAMVVAADVPADNGYIQVLDTVLIVPEATEG